MQHMFRQMCAVDHLPYVNKYEKQMTEVSIACRLEVSPVFPASQM